MKKRKTTIRKARRVEKMMLQRKEHTVIERDTITRNHTQTKITEKNTGWKNILGRDIKVISIRGISPKVLDSIQINSNSTFYQRMEFRCCDIAAFFNLPPEQGIMGY
jgi:hypothetical protein